MLSPQQEPLELKKEVTAKLSAYLNGATFAVDKNGRETFHPRIDTVEDDLIVIYMAERVGLGKVDLHVSLGLRGPEPMRRVIGMYDITDFGFDLVEYHSDQRITAEWEKKTQRVCRNLNFDTTYTIVPHGDDGGAEVRDPARKPPPELRETNLPPRTSISVGESGALAGRRG